MSSKFGKIRPWTMELAALGHLKKNPIDIMERMRSSHFLLFILTGNDDIHKSLDEFEIRPGPTTDHRVALKRLKALMFPFFSLCIIALR